SECSKVCQTLNELIPYDDNSRYWHSAFNQLIKFKEQNKEAIETDIGTYNPDSKARKLREEEFLDGINLADISFESTASFINSINTKQKEARDETLYIGSDDILKHFSRLLESKDRITFLNLLSDDQVIDAFS
ncbi:hypothetical protein, partial [Vibrio paracholerae]